MKAQTKMIAASLVVIMLALSAVGGVTYSWFSDSEETDINVSTASMDIKATWGNAVITPNDGNTTATVNAQTGSISIGNLVSDRTILFAYNLSYKSSIDTVYRVYAEISYDDNSQLDQNDKDNIFVNGNKLSTADNEGKIILVDWKSLEKTTGEEYINLTDISKITINTEGNYTPTKVNGAIPSKNFGVKIVAELYQGDYPYDTKNVIVNNGEATITEELLSGSNLVVSSNLTENGQTVDVEIDFDSASLQTMKNESITKITVEKAETNNIQVNDGEVAIAAIDVTVGDSNTSFNLNGQAIVSITVSGYVSNPVVYYYDETSMSSTEATIINSSYDSVENTTTIKFIATHFSLYYVSNAPEDTKVWDGSISMPIIDDDEKTVTIKTASQLAGFAQIVNDGISFTGYTVNLESDLNLNGIEWVPIGNSTNKFSGKFDGQSNTISNLNVDMPGISYVGLFGFTTGGEIKNLTVENANVTGRLGVGVVAGSPYTSMYSNINVIGHIEVTGMAYVGGVGGRNAYASWTNIVIDADDTSFVKANSVENEVAYRTYVGGVIGFMGEGGHKLTNVTSNIDVIGSTIDVGGIVGIAHYGNSFIDCSSSGDVTITNAADASDVEEIGGIAGVWHNQNGTTVTFKDCVFTGTLKTNITEGVDLTDNTITGKAYSSSGTGVLIIENT